MNSTKKDPRKKRKGFFGGLASNQAGDGNPIVTSLPSL